MQCATTKIHFKEIFFEHIRGNECTLSIGKLKCCSYQCRFNTLGKLVQYNRLFNTHWIDYYRSRYMLFRSPLNNSAQLHWPKHKIVNDSKVITLMVYITALYND